MKTALESRWVLPLLLLAYLGLAAGAWLAIPPFESPDEPEHVAYVRHLQQQRSLPESLPTTQLDGNSQANQAPLAYLVMALVSAPLADQASGELRRNPGFTTASGPLGSAVLLPTADAIWPWSGAVPALLAARLVNLALGAAAIVMTWLLARRLAPTATGAALLAVAVLAFRPGFLASAATVNNDMAVLAIGGGLSLALVVMLRRGPRPWLALASGGLLGLAVLAKENALAVAPLVVVTPLLTRWTLQDAAGWLGRWVAAALAIAAALLVGGWWFVRNLVLEGSLLRKEGDYAGAGGLDFGSFGVLRDYLVSWVGSFGWQQVDLPGWYYLAGALLLAVATVGLVLDLARARRDGGLAERLLLVALVATMLAVVEVNRQLSGRPGTAHLRLAAPAGVAAAVLVGLGLGRFLSAVLRRPRLVLAASGGVTIAMVMATAGALPGVASAFPQPVPVRASLAGWGLAPHVPTSFAGRVDLVGVSSRARPDGGRVVDLYWRRGDAATAEPLAAFVHGVDAAGLVAQDDRPIGEPLLPLPAWPSEWVYRTRHQVEPGAREPLRWLAGVYEPGAGGGRLEPAGGALAGERTVELALR